MTYFNFEETDPRILKARIRDLDNIKRYAPSEVENERAQIEIEHLEARIKRIEAIKKD